MKCAWDALLSVLPLSIRREVDSLGRESMQELRLRIKTPPELVLGSGVRWLSSNVTREDLLFCLNAASRYSPWAASSASQGYLTAPGGHRIGLCGEAVLGAGGVMTMKNLTSLCIRVARDYPGVSGNLAGRTGSTLILGAPGWGKTTLLRDLIREKSQRGSHIAVVDERGELFPEGFSPGKRTDVLTGCSKPAGIPMLLKTMGPTCIAVDEITSPEDAAALMEAAGCGVQLLATAHGTRREDLQAREVYRKLAAAQIFDTIVILHQDKSWHTERSTQWYTNGSVRC